MKTLFKDLTKRLIVSSISIFFVGIIIYFSSFKLFFVVAVVVATSLGVYEYIKLVEAKKFFLNKNLLFLAVVVQIFSLFLYTQADHWKFLPFFSLFLLILLFFLVHLRKIQGAIADLALNVFALMYLIVPMSLILPIIYFQKDDGRIWLVYLIVVTKITDVGAYFGGKLLGKHKLAREISPNKTVEGAFIGLVCAVVASYLFSFVFKGASFSPYLFLVLGLVLGVLAQIGDLCESLLKRDAAIKDSSALPGVGGILDMLDSLLLSIPALFFFLEVVL